MRAFSSPSISRIHAAGIGASAALILAACAGSGAIPHPTPTHLEYAERGGYTATLPSLENGRRLYVNRCSGCHTLYSPSAFKAQDWPRLVRDMQANAEINEDQVRDITRYLFAVAAAYQDAGKPRPTNTTPAIPGDSAPEPVP
jgi:mono/diheme cytochrome c family protein